MNRNFPCAYDMELEDVREWAQSRETALPVAVAIWAIADGQRTAQRIWEKPTPSEWDQITMALDEYLRHGDFARSPDGLYKWGPEHVKCPAPC
jgi:hypothetical protein